MNQEQFLALDVTGLKALAYDTIVSLEQIQAQLKTINARIVEVQQAPVETPAAPEASDVA